MPTFRNEFPIFYLEGLFPDVWLFPTFYLNKGCILDITVNLLDGTYEPYHKPENTLQYIHKESNHPQNIIKQIPVTFETRISNHSSNETVSCHAAEYYEKTRKKSGYNVKLQYKPTNQNTNNKINCKRNII